MPRTKRQKWERNQALDRVFQPSIRDAVDGPTELHGRWATDVFANDHPITLELGCGRGEYTVELARSQPERNFVGVDIKGHRFWHGARVVQEDQLTNAAFLRAKIEFIENHFAPGEVSELWLPFSDPQPRDDKGTKRLTGAPFLARYRRLLGGGGIVHVKTDSRLLYERTLESARESDAEVVLRSEDVHGGFVDGVAESLAQCLRIITRYESGWMRRGRAIFYLQLRV